MRRGVWSLVVVLAGSLAVGGCAAGDGAGPGGSTSAKPGSAAATAKASASAKPSKSATPSATPVERAQELAVVETGFGRQTYDTSTWWYTVVAKNPNTDWFFQSARITVEAVDASGTILDSANDYVNILPGDFAVTGVFLDVAAGEIDHLNVRGPVATEATKAPKDGIGSLSTSDVSASSDRFSTSVTGIVTGTFAKEQERVQVTVIAKDAAGKVIGGDRTYVERLPVDGRVQFSVEFLDPLPPDTTYAAYASL